MKRYEVKTRYKISKYQLDILVLIVKYRFVSSALLASCLGKDKSTIYERLSVLVDQEYIAKKYDMTYKLRHRPVIYYLAPAGIRYLMKAGYPRARLHYKSKDFTDEQIDEHFMLKELAETVCKPYTHAFELRTKYEASVDEFCITPASYAQLVGTSDDTSDYFIEYFPRFFESWKIRKRINQHTNYAFDHDEYRYPNLLFVCGNESTMKRVIRLTADTYTTIDIFCTTIDRVRSGEKNIWLRPVDVYWDEELPYIPLPLTLSA